MDGNKMNTVKETMAEVSTDVFVDVIDNLCDILSENSLVDAIPYVKSVVAILKVSKAYSDARTLEKVSAFFENCKDIEVDEVKCFLGNRDEKKIGKLFIDSINSLDSDEKCKLAGMVYKQMVEERWNLESFQRIVQVIKTCFYKDLLELVKFPDDKLLNDGKIIETEVVQSLFGCGVLIECGFDGGTLNDGGGILYELNRYGVVIKTCLKSISS